MSAINQLLRNRKAVTEYSKGLLEGFSARRKADKKLTEKDKQEEQKAFLYLRGR